MVHTMLFAGGTGRRMTNSSIPKQFIEVDGKPIIVRTIENFAYHPQVDDIVIACIPSGIDHLSDLIRKYNLPKVISIVPGGTTGYRSIHNGVLEIAKKAKEDDIILICDGVRPVMSASLISECIDLARKFETAVPVVPCIDSVLRSDNGVTSSLNMARENMYTTQAPQGYTMRKILWAHQEVERLGIADPISSADLLISLGEEVHIFRGERDNIKVTTPEDLYTLRAHYYYARFKRFAQEELQNELL